MAGWTQPTLDGASVKAFWFSASHHYMTGWKGTLDVIQEGERVATRMISLNELTTEQMAEGLLVVLEQLRVLLGYDERPF